MSTDKKGGALLFMLGILMLVVILASGTSYYIYSNHKTALHAVRQEQAAQAADAAVAVAILHLDNYFETSNISENPPTFLNLPTEIFFLSESENISFALASPAQLVSTCENEWIYGFTATGAANKTRVHIEIKLAYGLEKISVPGEITVGEAETLKIAPGRVIEYKIKESW